MQNLPYDVKKIIQIANALVSTGKTGGSTGEVIAAAFVLDRMDFLPDGYTIIEVWERLDAEWQAYVRFIKIEHSHLLVPW